MQGRLSGIRNGQVKAASLVAVTLTRSPAAQRLSRSPTRLTFSRSRFRTSSRVSEPQKPRVQLARFFIRTCSIATWQAIASLRAVWYRHPLMSPLYKPTCPTHQSSCNQLLMAASFNLRSCSTLICSSSRQISNSRCSNRHTFQPQWQMKTFTMSQVA